MEVPELLGQWANYALIWIGFGTLVGLAAKAIMPGRDPGGALSTVLMGILGCVLGAGGLAYFSEDLRITPLSPIGFGVATVGAFLLLALHRLMLPRWHRLGWPRWTRSRSRRRVAVVEEE